MFYVAFPTFFGKRAARDGQWGQITDACKAERRVAEHRGRYNTTGRCPDCTMKGRGSHRLPWPGITTSRGQNLLVLPSTHENTGRYTFVNYLVLAKICHGGVHSLQKESTGRTNWRSRVFWFYAVVVHSTG